MRWWIVLALAAALGACTPDTSSATSTTAAETPSTTTTAPSDATDACVAGDLAFDSDGLIAAVGEAESDATAISQIRWERGATCERLVISFASDSGAPATTLGVTGVTVIGFEGIVRIDLPDTIVASAVADQLTDSLIHHTFVVRDEQTGMYIDIHTAGESGIAARAFTVASPASLVVDIVLDPSLPAPSGAAIGDAAVMVSPVNGPALYPFTVEAYVPPQLVSTNVVISEGDEEASSLTVGLPGYTDTWQGITTRIDDGPSGTVTVYVGNLDATGSLDSGASVALDLP